MSELVEVPKWFDDIHKALIDAIINKLKFYQEPEKLAKGILVAVIGNLEFNPNPSMDNFIKELRYFNDKSLSLKIFRENEDEKIYYISEHKFELIKALISGYKVKEDSYLVVSRNDYENNEYIYDNSATSYHGYVSQIVKYKQLYYYEDDKQLEKFKELDSNLLTSGLMFGKFKPELIKQIQEIEPRLIMNEEKAKNLVNGHRIIVPINI